RAEAPQHLVLLERREPEQDDDPVAEHHAISGRPDFERERRRRNDVAALEPGGVDPFSHQQGTGGEPLGRGGGMAGDGSIGHTGTYAKRRSCPSPGGWCGATLI